MFSKLLKVHNICIIKREQRLLAFPDTLVNSREYMMLSIHPSHILSFGVKMICLSNENIFHKLFPSTACTVLDRHGGSKSAFGGGGRVPILKIAWLHSCSYFPLLI